MSIAEWRALAKLIAAREDELDRAVLDAVDRERRVSAGLFKPLSGPKGDSEGDVVGADAEERIRALADDTDGDTDTEGDGEGDGEGVPLDITPNP